MRSGPGWPGGSPTAGGDGAVSGSLAGAIACAWVDPRAAMARQVREGLSESRSLFHLMLAAGLLFVASLPAAVRTSRTLAIDEPLNGVISAHIFGYFFLAPLLAYGVAAASHLFARVFGARGGFIGARAALFWSLLVAAPAALAIAAVGTIAEMIHGGALPIFGLLGYAGLAFWLWIFAASLAEAERLGPTWQVALAAAVALAALVALLAALTLVVRGGARA